jgi:Kef-type K+ transport system membrane component KefB
MDYMPGIELNLNTITLLGIALLLGLVGGELARSIRFMPTISGYILIGFLLGPDALQILNHSVLVTVRLFIDISLGLVMFDLGRQLDFSWLRHDKGLLLTAIAESSLTFIFIFLLAYYFIGFTWLPAAMAATFAMATSPAVVMMVANELKSEGPVTRRTLVLTSLNNLFALTLFTILLPVAQPISTHSVAVWLYSCYALFGSILLALAMFIVTRLSARLIGKKKESQFILFVGALVFTIGISQAINLPTAIILFFFGIATRNLDHKHVLMEIDFGANAQLFFILLFVATGTYLRLEGLRTAAIAVITFILVRTLAKTIGILLFSNKSRLTRQQVFAVSLALTPMAGLAISMSNVLEDFNPDLNHQISIIIAAVVAILEIVGPIATQFAFIKCRESIADRI